MLKSLSIIRYIDYADDIDMPFFFKTNANYSKSLKQLMKNYDWCYSTTEVGSLKIEVYNSDYMSMPMHQPFMSHHLHFNFLATG